MLYKEAYSLSHCYQYEIRLQNQEKDLNESQLTKEEANSLTIDDFEFKYVPREDLSNCQDIKRFIERHEWLGSMPHRPTHRFIATYKGRIAGAIVMSTPNAFSNLLGKENRDLEKLISRGACISWSPKNLASALIMHSIRWMVRNTPYRIFTAYSDVEARELGTIYQACNFIYLGQKAGARAKYFDAENPDKGWFTDRIFRHVCQFKRYARKLNLPWKDEFASRRGMNWNFIPPEIERQLREASSLHQRNCIKHPLVKKHKYAYILGQTKNETRTLRRIFILRNLHLAGLNYPKQRGV